MRCSFFAPKIFWQDPKTSFLDYFLGTLGDALRDNGKTQRNEYAGLLAPLPLDVNGPVVQLD